VYSIVSLRMDYHTLDLAVKFCLIGLSAFCPRVWPRLRALGQEARKLMRWVNLMATTGSIGGWVKCSISDRDRRVTAVLRVVETAVPPINRRRWWRRRPIRGLAHVSASRRSTYNNAVNTNNFWSLAFFSSLFFLSLLFTSPSPLKSSQEVWVQSFWGPELRLGTQFYKFQLSKRILSSHGNILVVYAQCK